MTPEWEIYTFEPNPYTLQLFIHYNQSIPNIGDIIIIDNYSLQVVDKDGTKVDKILITLVNKTK
jgi:CBS domain containing-hemolysin-like protein